jgi:hypothetical protein
MNPPLYNISAHACVWGPHTVCSGLDFVKPTADGIAHFDYEIAPGNVPFYASDMRNTAGWRRKEDFVFGADSYDDYANGIFATHSCTWVHGLRKSLGKEGVVHAMAKKGASL